MRHVLVTGPSGAGKTTLAANLAKRLRLPVYHLDSHPAWQRYLCQDRDSVQRLLARRDRRSEEYGHYMAARLAAVEEALGLEAPHIVEGCQLLGFPDLARDYPCYLVRPPMAVALAQRLMRKDIKRVWRGEPLLAGDELTAAILIGRLVYDSTATEVAKFDRLSSVVSIETNRYHGPLPWPWSA